MDPSVLLAIFSGTQIGSGSIDMDPFIQALHIAFAVGVVASLLGAVVSASRGGKQVIEDEPTVQRLGGRMTTMQRGMSAFRHRNYRLFFVGQAISLVGTWMQQVAQSWLVLVLTHDPLWLGVVAAAQFIPVMIFGLFAGVLADNLPKRQTLLVTQAIKMCLSVILAIIAVTGYASIPLLILLALIIGTVNSVDMPVRQAFAVEMVGREDIGNAVALNSAMFNGARVIGPAIAGLTIARGRGRGGLRVDAVELPGGHRRPGADARERAALTGGRSPIPTRSRRVMTQLREGLHYVRITPLVLLAVLVVGLVSTFGMNFSVIIPAYADGRPRQRRCRLRLPDGGVRRRLAGGRAVARLRGQRAGPAHRLRRGHARHRRGRARCVAGLRAVAAADGRSSGSAGS